MLNPTRPENNFLRSVLENSHSVPILVTDSNSGRICTVTEAGCAFLGRQAHELTNRQLEDFTIAEDKAAVGECQRQLDKANGHRAVCEITLFLPDGQRLPAHITILGSDTPDDRTHQLIMMRKIDKITGG